MVVPIEENTLIFVAGAVFIPIIVFMVKLVVDVGIIKGAVAQMQKQIERIERSSDDNLSGSVTGRGIRR